MLCTLFMSSFGTSIIYPITLTALKILQVYISPPCDVMVAKASVQFPNRFLNIIITPFLLRLIFLSVTATRHTPGLASSSKKDF